MSGLGGHSRAKYTTGTLIGTSEGRGWNGLLAERWFSSEGDLGEVEVRDTEVIVMIEGNLPISRRGDGKLEHCHAVPGTVRLCPNGPREDMIRLYGEVCESVHLFLPALPLSRTALREIDVDPDKVELRYLGGFRDPLIEHIARAIRAEMTDAAPAGKMQVETLSAALGVHVVRRYSDLAPASISLPAARGALDSRRLRRVIEFIESHLGDDLKIETLARKACLSPFHFARAFKTATGSAPHRYISESRIGRAKALMASGELTLNQIAGACGFSSQAHFNRSFKRFVGATPGEYRSCCGPLPDRAAWIRNDSRDGNAMDLTRERKGDVLSIGVRGRIDSMSARIFAAAVRDATAKSDRAVILDFRDLVSICSSGLRAILLIAGDLRRRDARLVLCGLSGPIREVFRTTGFDRILPIHASEAEARASLDG